MRRLLALLSVFAIACGGDSSTAPTATVAGTWSLQTINGAALPFVIAQSGADKLEVLSDVYTISGTGSFTETTTVRNTTNGVATTQSLADGGSYTVSGTTVMLRYNSDGSVGTGSWTGNTIAVTDGGLALIYTR